MIGVLLLLGCGEGRFDRLSDALAAYDRGRTLLSAQRAPEAVVAMEQATERDPRSPELQLWLGTARAEAGDLAGAIEAASQALALKPGWPLALYDRACWRLRTGDAAQIDAARGDLRLALASGEINPLDVVQDPDITPFIQDPRLRDLLPTPALPASIEAPDGAVFWGSDWVLTLSVSARPGDELRFDGVPALPSALSPAQVLETVEPAGMLEKHTLRLRFVVVGAGEGSLGPFRVSAGGLSAELPAVPYTLLAPPERAQGPEPWSESPFFWPGVRFKELEEPGLRTGAAVLVRAGPGDEILLEPPPLHAMDVELRRDERPLWIGRIADPAPDTLITVRRTGKEILQDRSEPY